MDSIIESIKSIKPKRLQFTGGEPTFFAKEINQIINSHPDIDNAL